MRTANLGVILVIVGLIAVLMLMPGQFAAGEPAPLRVLLGWGAFPAAAVLLLGGVAVAFAEKLGWQVRWRAIFAAELMVLALLALAHLTALALSGTSTGLALAHSGAGGGLVGWALVDLAAILLPVELIWAAAAAGFVAAGILLWRSLPRAWTERPEAGVARLARRIAAAVAGRGPGAGGTIHRQHKPAQGSTPGVNVGRLVAILSAAGSAFKRRVLPPGWPRRLLTVLGNFWRNLQPAPAAPEPPAPRKTKNTGTAPGARSHSPAPVAQPTGRPVGQPPAARSVAPPPAPSASPAPSATTPPATPLASSRPRHRSQGLPPLDLLRPDDGNRYGGPDARQRGQLIKQTLAEFGIPVEIVSIKEGPTVTQFGLEPGEIVKELRGGEVVRRRVSVHSIQRLSNDLALALAAASVRIEAPVPGRPYVGIEIPNATKTLVSLRSVLESREFSRVNSPLALALGRDVAGEPVVADLTRLPHLLIAGATGSGKSVCINAIVCGLLMNNGPERVRFMMVDPKMVELPGYNGIPHLLGPVITDPGQVTAALAWLTLQMDERYRLFAESGVRNIAEYNKKFSRSRTVEPLPYLVLVIDELADLMMTAAYDVERQICRLAQMARATGIHLVIATQRPSVDVITGLIKANFPARIAFAVTSQIDSRVILDSPGAERLLGRGDMLFMQPEVAKLIRIQGCFVSDQEIDSIVAFWRSGQAEPPTVAPWAGFSVGEEERHDELLERALDLLRTRQTISTSMLQRQLRIGFPRAARLMEQLEEMGVVGQDAGGGRSREVRLRTEAEATK